MNLNILDLEINLNSIALNSTPWLMKPPGLQLSLRVVGMTLNYIHIFIVTGSFLYWCVMRPASHRFFIHSCIYLRILIISCLTTFLSTNSLSVLMCRKAVNQSISYPCTYLEINCRFLLLFSNQSSTNLCHNMLAFSLMHLRLEKL